MTGVKLPEPISHAERCRGQIIESALAMSMYSHLVQKAVYGSVPCSATRIFKGLTVRSGPCRLGTVTET